MCLCSAGLGRGRGPSARSARPRADRPLPPHSSMASFFLSTIISQSVQRGIVRRDGGFGCVMEQDRGLVVFPWESSGEAAASCCSNPPGWVSALFYIFGVNRLLPICTRVRLCTVCPRFAVKVECLQEVSGGRRLPWVLLHCQDKRIILCSSLPEWMGDGKVLGDH